MIPSREHEPLSDLDRHFARFIARFGGGQEVALAAMWLSRAVRSGHLCLDLNTAPPETQRTEWPGPEEWRAALGHSRAVGLPGSEATPLVLDPANRLYLRRYYEEEQALARELLQRAVPIDGAPPNDPAAEEADLQLAAVGTALRQQLAIISGGPGTGKTTTVVKFLRRLLALEKEGPLPRVALCAPTGKAAARLEEAVRHGLQSPLADQPDPRLSLFLETLPRAATLDRLLGTRPDTMALRHHRANPLPVDLAIVDEASMVAVPLMAKFLDALPPQARLLLLGDRDQLASVAPGSILADLAQAAAQPGHPLAPTMVTLTHNHRFGNESGIYQLCQAVRTGEAQAALALLSTPAPKGDYSMTPLPAPDALAATLREPILAAYRPFLEAMANPAEALAAFGRFRLLAALRKGPYGIANLNAVIETILREAGLIETGRGLYAGLPLLVTRNDPALRLFNGDIGLLLPDHDDPERLSAWFAHENGVRRISPARLPDWEPAYAMTVHKSQGSEFDEVLLILPERDTPVLTRELIYTGITRARHRVDLWLEPETFTLGVQRRAERTSGLVDALTP